MVKEGNYLSFLDIQHKPELLPNVKKETNSKCGISLSIFFFISYIAYEIFLITDYNNDYKLTYSQGFRKSKVDTNQKLTFGFRLYNSFNDSVKLTVLNSSNHIIDENLVKKCNPQLQEIKENINSTNNYICFMDYPIMSIQKTN